MLKWRMESYNTFRYKKEMYGKVRVADEYFSSAES